MTQENDKSIEELRTDCCQMQQRIDQMEAAAESLRLTRDYHAQCAQDYRRAWAKLVAAEKRGDAVAPQPPVQIVLPERDYSYTHNSISTARKDGWNECLDEVARLNAAAPKADVELPVAVEVLNELRRVLGELTVERDAARESMYGLDEITERQVAMIAELEAINLKLQLEVDAMEAAEEDLLLELSAIKEKLHTVEPELRSLQDTRNLADEIVETMIRRAESAEAELAAIKLMFDIGSLIVQHPSGQVLDEIPCSTHPDAPHGFNRTSSHSLDRYVCDCEGWTPPPKAVCPDCFDITGCKSCAPKPPVQSENQCGRCGYPNTTGAHCEHHSLAAAPKADVQEPDYYAVTGEFNCSLQKDYPQWAEGDDSLKIMALYAAPQPSDDVALLKESLSALENVCQIDTYIDFAGIYETKRKLAAAIDAAIGSKGE